MHNIDPAHYAIFFVGVGGIMFLITLTYLFSFLVLKIDRPKFKWLILIAFLQVLLGTLTFITIIILEDYSFNMGIVFLFALAVMLLSGLFLGKLLLNYSWKQTLSIWAVAGGIQVVVGPICSLILAFISFLIAILSLPEPL